MLRAVEGSGLTTGGLPHNGRRNDCSELDGSAGGKPLQLVGGLSRPTLGGHDLVEGRSQRLAVHHRHLTADLLDQLELVNLLLLQGHELL